MEEDNNTLQSLHEHLCYEIQMLIETSFLLRDPKNYQFESEAQLVFMNNALLESFCIHARNLIDFLYAKKQKNDIVAEMFFIGNEWKKNSNDFPMLLNEIRESVNKRVLHLTLTRINKFKWSHQEITKIIFEELDKFFILISDKELLRYYDYYKNIINEASNDLT